MLSIMMMNMLHIFSPGFHNFINLLSDTCAQAMYCATYQHNYLDWEYPGMGRAVTFMSIQVNTPYHIGELIYYVKTDIYSVFFKCYMFSM